MKEEPMSLAPRLAAVRLLAILAVAAFGLVGRVAQAAPAQQGTAAVMIRGFKFEPAATTVAVGTVVTWTNQDTAPHTATSVTAGKFDTGTIEQNQSKSVTLNEAGTFEYFCQIHPQMRGTLTVTAAQAPAPAAQATAAAPAAQATAAAPAAQATAAAPAPAAQATAAAPAAQAPAAQATAAAAPAAAADMMLSATLLGGAEEVPNPGDPDGTGTSMVTLKTAGGQVCWDTRVANITMPAAASHIHRGARGVAGPVVVPLTPPGADGRASGCAAVEAGLLNEIAQNPAGFYVNVHTSDFPGGAVRGQLAAGAATPAPARGAPAQLPPTGEAPAPVALPDTGMSDGQGTLMVGVALLILLAGLGVSWSVRRRTSTR